jgi:teichuronopeptide biosynthesis TupA-like protein
MLDVAERLGAATDFVRVDLYLLPGRVVVGELTSFPAGGDSPFEPSSFDLEFGRPWTVPRRYR